MNKKMDHDLTLRILKQFVLDECVGADFDMLTRDQTLSVMREWWNKNRFKYTVAKPTTNRVLEMARQMRREQAAKSDGGGLLSSGYDDGVLVGIDRIIGLIERTGYNPNAAPDRLTDLYKELQKRHEYLESQPKTPETEARMLENTLCIVRVQQMLLENLTPKNKPETSK